MYGIGMTDTTVHLIIAKAISIGLKSNNDRRKLQPWEHVKIRPPVI